MATYRLRPNFVMPALAAGSTVGAGAVAVFFSAPMFLHNPSTGLIWLLPTFVVALILWIIGLAVFGAPVWWFSERAGRRSPAWALGAGLVIGFCVWMTLTLLLQGATMYSSVGGHVIIEGGRLTLYGWLMLLKDSVMMSVLCGLVAAVIWRTAYRRTETI